MIAPTIVAVGFSVRALVEACAILGLRTIAVDHFGDADTRQFAEGRWIPLEVDAQGGLAKATLEGIQAVACSKESDFCQFVVLMAGGMENLPQAVEQLGGMLPVLGPTVPQLALLRDPRFLALVAEQADLDFPDTQLMSPDRDQLRDNRWLWKPFRSAGGHQIVPLTAMPNVPSAIGGYFQRTVVGQQLGVSVVLSKSEMRILGATYGLDSDDWPGPCPTIYRGSIGPISLADRWRAQISELGRYLQQRLDVRGWLQFDFLIDADDRLWLLECNPRWTAGMELLSQAGGAPLESPVSEHLAAWGVSLAVRPSRLDWNVGRFLSGKAIVYALRRTAIDSIGIQRLAQLSREGWLADIPATEQVIEPGHPIATVRTLNEIAEGKEAMDRVKERLIVRRSQLLAILS